LYNAVTIFYNNDGAYIIFADQTKFWCKFYTFTFYT